MKTHLFYYVISFQIYLSSFSIDITVGKLEVSRSETSAYQETYGLNLYPTNMENWASS
jgi:hypothetical protein